MTIFCRRPWLTAYANGPVFGDLPGMAIQKPLAMKLDRPNWQRHNSPRDMNPISLVD
jgi:hypothetical protein